MSESNYKIFCDFVTVSQTHDKPHEPYNDGFKTVERLGEPTRRVALTKSLRGDHGSNLQIASDGRTVRVSGNPGRWNRSENLYAPDLDQTKNLINSILVSQNLPPFTGGETISLPSDHSEVYNGATFSRIDMTANIQTGSASNRTAFLQHQQTQEFPRLTKHLTGLNMYYGKESETRTILIYDKGLHLEKEVLKKTDEKKYIQRLINYCNDKGIIRFEARYSRFLRKINARKWDQATQKKLGDQCLKDMEIMTKKIESPDYDGIPNAVLGTLTMYMAGINVKKRLSHQTYYKHRKILLGFGYDISNQNTSLISPKVKIITLEPAEVPDFYKHANLTAV